MATKNKKTADDSKYYIVGIGASAGGLEAINELFDNIPGDTNMSFIIIQHLSPDYKSLMGELLSKHTTMQVFEGEENMHIKPNCVYLLPTRKTMTVKDGMLKLHDKVYNAKPNNAIDVFFESLALAKKEKAIGIILSGTGTDGTKGIEAIKNNGGIVIVQDPITAEFNGMPNSAIATGYADLILPPEMMPEELMEFLKETPLLKSFNALNNYEEALLLDILELIHKVTGHDFSHYKRPTITRRLSKRMLEKGYKTLADYYDHLKRNAEEVNALCSEFLINVTKFFRDEDAFNIIQTTVIPAIFHDKLAGDTVKIWTVACSSGEEAYSLAILLQEYMESNNKHAVNVKIFATDIDGDAIITASKGTYPDTIAKDISPERIKQFFIKEGSSYRIIPALRKMVVFAKHDISKDPPFSRLDLLVCRNMLIYMNPGLQKNILQKFHFAINDGGYLILGPSENIGALKDVMKELDKKWKIYKCISKEKSEDHETFLNPVHRSYVQVPVTSKSKNALSNIAEIFKETLLEEYDYAGIYIDKDFEVKQAIGNFKKYINFPEDSFNFNLLKLVPTDLSIALSTCIRKAMKTGEKVIMKKINVAYGKSRKSINIIVKPYLMQSVYLQPFIFIIFSEETSETKPASGTKIKDGYVSERLTELEKELADTKENLQAVIEEVESANEELQSSNEEIISSNEELQSTNEELQSLNEELHTVNAEHQLKIKELVELNDDMNNYFRNTDIGQILIDKKLIIRKFSPAATKQVNMINSDVGRSIVDISVNFKNLDFINDIKGVIKSGVQVEKELVMDNKDTFLMRIAPYVRLDKAIDGVVVNFINISEVKRLNSLIEAVFNSSVNGITAQKFIRNKAGKAIDLEIITANEAFANMVGATADSLKGHSMYKELPDFMAANFDKCVNVLDRDDHCRFEYFDNKKQVWLEINIVRMLDGVVSTFTDITDKKRSFTELQDTSNMLRASNQQLEQSNYDLLQFASVASHDLKEPLRKIQTFGNKLKDKVETKLEDNEINYLDKIINASNRMQTLIEDILMLAKLSNSEIERSKVNLNEILHHIEDDLEIVLREKNVQLDIGKLPTVKAIPGQIHQLFQNLILNAIKFNENDPPVIKIANEEIDKAWAKALDIDGDKYICITVSDNGIGFEQEYSEKIFGIFQRLNGSNYHGTGIGLAICKKIIDNHNGMIMAESKVNEGSKFTLLIPKS